MQAIFTEVTRRDVDAVRARIERDPELVNTVAKGAPRKYTGQSLLQVALRSEQCPIVQMVGLLLDAGADASFSQEAAGDDWIVPLVHSAAVAETRDRAPDAAFETLVRVLDVGADVHAADSFANSVLGRAVGQANDLEDPQKRDAIAPIRVAAEFRGVIGH